jgi:CheY-like chemotaxis protein
MNPAVPGAPLTSHVRPILLVEDNAMDLDLTLQAFEESSIANPVVSCRDGDEALDYMAQHPSPSDPHLPLLVLLDLRLPKVDGLEVLGAIRQHPIWKHIPVIVMTTSRENRDIETAYAMGASAYIVKPVEFEPFARVVKAIKVFWVLTNEAPFPGTPGW